MNENDFKDEPASGKQSMARCIFKYLFVCMVLLLVFFLTAFFAGNHYLQSNKQKILKDLPFLDNSSISFNSVNLNLFRHFPHITLSFENVAVMDSLWKEHQQIPLKAGKIELSLSLKSWRHQNFEVEAIRFFDGAFTSYKDSTGYSNIGSLLKKQGTQNGRKNYRNRPVKINTQNIEVSAQNMGIHISDAIKTTSIHGTINALESKLNLSDKSNILGAVSMDLGVEELTFKKENGTFLANSSVRGSFNAQFKEGILEIEPFEAHINEQYFLVSTSFDPSKECLSRLTFENPQTEYCEVLPLLPLQLQESLFPYQVEGLFYAKVNVFSHFKPQENPLVEVDLKMEGNDLLIQGSLFEGAVLEGRFVNRLHEEERSLLEEKGNLRFEIKYMESRYINFDLQTENALIVATPKEGAKIEIDLNVKGKASGISDWLKNEQFFFDKGTFNLDAQVSAPLGDLNAVIMASDAQLQLKNISVIYNPANVSFPFKELQLNKKVGDADFMLISSTFAQENDYQIEGGVRNISPLLISLKGQRVSSDAELKASKLGWEDFVEMFGANGYLKTDQPKTDIQKKESMKETIIGIQHSFQPSFSMLIDTLTYYDLVHLHQFKTGVHFEDERILVLEETSFRYEEGSVDFNGRADISMPYKTPFEFELHAKNINLQKLLPSLNYFDVKLLENLNAEYPNIDVDIELKGIMDDRGGLVPKSAVGEMTFNSRYVRGKVQFQPEIMRGDSLVMRTQLSLKGAPSVFNDFFETEQFFFDKGIFKVDFDFEGEVSSFENLLQEAVASLTIENSEVYYKTADIRFPLTEVQMDLEQNIGDFHLFMYSDSLQQELDFTGQIDNIGELVLGNTGKPFYTHVAINSPILTWSNFQDLLVSSSKVNTEKRQIDNALKESIKGILNTFNPKLQLQVDTFVYSDKLLVRDVKTRVELVDSSILALYDTGFCFHNGVVNLRGELDISALDETPFSANFYTKDLDFAALLESLDYLSINAFKEMEKLQGNITMNLEIEGVIGGEKNGLVPEKTKGVLDFELRGVQIKGLSIIDDIAAKLKKKKRFSDIAFAPIANRITINGTFLDIPLMEIQSNVLNLFVEGTVAPSNQTNIWISVPMKNLKKPKKDTIPEKRGYSATKNKVYLELSADKEGKYKMKFRLKKKKFYEYRGMTERFKADKKERQRLRKERRKEKEK